MQDPNEGSEEKGVVDGVSLLYIALGVPGIFLFLILLFGAARIWNLPA